MTRRPSSSPRRSTARLAGLAFAAACAWQPAPVAAQPRVLSVPSVDPQRYGGTWYEVARLPNRFQEQCVGDVSAQYTPRPDGTIAVVNRCRTDTGWDVAEGLAQPTDETNAKLRVSFLPSALRWLPFGRGDYWVLELDPDYRWAMVGDPGREYLWLLSRAPVLQQDVLEGLLGRAREMGFPVDKVALTPQKPAGSAPVPAPTSSRAEARR